MSLRGNGRTVCHDCGGSMGQDANPWLGICGPCSTPSKMCVEGCGELADADEDECHGRCAPCALATAGGVA